MPLPTRLAVAFSNFKTRGIEAAEFPPPYTLRGSVECYSFYSAASLTQSWPALCFTVAPSLDGLRLFVIECYSGDTFVGRCRADLRPLFTGPNESSSPGERRVSTTLELPLCCGRERTGEMSFGVASACWPRLSLCHIVVVPAPEGPPLRAELTCALRGGDGDALRVSALAEAGGEGAAKWAALPPLDGDFAGPGRLALRNAAGVPVAGADLVVRAGALELRMDAEMGESQEHHLSGEFVFADDVAKGLLSLDENEKPLESVNHANRRMGAKMRVAWEIDVLRSE